MRKIVLAQIDTIQPLAFMTNHGFGIWSAKLTMSPEEKSASFFVTAFGASLDSVNEDELTIGSVSIGAEQYIPVSSFSDMYLQEKSFLWVQGTQTIYIRFDNPYWIFANITAGKVTGFISQAQEDSAGMPTNSIIGSVYYEPRLIASSIKADQSIDPLEYGIFRHDTISFQIDNSNGEFDNLNELSAGQGVRILYASCEDDETITADDFKVMRRGYVETISFSGQDKLTVNGVDLRKKWSDKINTELLTQTEYPSLKDSDVDKRKPLCVGTLYNVPCVQIDTEKFMFSTVTYGNMVSVDKVYVDGVSTAYSGTYTDGTFTISGYTSGTVTADVTGVDKGNDVEKIVWLLDEFYNLSYINSNFNVGEIDIASVSSKTGSLYISKSGETLKSVITRLLRNIGGWLFQQGDIFTIRVYDENRAEAKEILYDELSAFPDRGYDEQQFFSSVTTSYHKDESEKEFYTYYDDSKEDEAVSNQYRLTNKDIETTLLTEADAAEIGARFYNRFIDIPATLSMSIESDISGYYPTDIFVYEHKRPQKLNESGFTEESIILPRSNYMVTNISWITGNVTLQMVKENPEEIYTEYELYNDELNNTSLYGGLNE